MMDRWIVELQFMLGRWIPSLANVRGRWLVAAMAVAVVSLLALVLALAVRRLSRRQTKTELLLSELQNEIESLRQAEERRALADLKSNNAFLQNLALELAESGPTALQTSDPTEDSAKTSGPVRFKIPSMG